MLQLIDITKSFGKNCVLDQVSLKVRPGEIHGLVGINGSGKSTLLNILFGNRSIAESGGFSGSYLLDGKPCSFKHSSQAVCRGVGMVHQEQALIPSLSVAANIAINKEPVHGFIQKILPRSILPVDSKTMRIQTVRSIDRLGIGHCENEAVETLSLNCKQFVEIAREISREDLKILLLDEPTAVLSSTDVKRFLKIIKETAQKGIAVLFVSHRLHEIAEICDHVTILRDGKIAARLEDSAITSKAISEAMVARDVKRTRRMSVNSNSRIKLSIRNFQVSVGQDQFHPLNLDVATSEVFGLTGLSGSGRNRIGYGIMGLSESTGTLHLDGEEIQISSPEQMLGRGFFLLPEERHKLGLLLNHSIQDNIAFASLHASSRFRSNNGIINRFFPDRKKIAAHAEQCVNRYSIDCTGIHQKVAELSGGNQQKVSMAHALTLAPDVLFINEPTRGVDIAAKEIILEQIVNTSKSSGTTVIISSSELDELRRICDRIGVMYRGKLQSILPPDSDESLFTRAMMGELEPVPV